MDNLPSKDQAYAYLKGWGNKVKQYAYNLTPMELKVEEATNNDAWGPTGTLMAEITDDAFDVRKYKEIMGVLAKRLQDEGEDWRHVYKSLLLLEYMCKHGPQKVIDELNGNPAVLRKLKDFEYKDAPGKDWGLNVRHRAKELGALVSDPEKMRTERSKAKQNKEKYVGVSSDDMRSGGGRKGGFSSSGFGSTGFGSGSSSRLDSDFDAKLKLGREGSDTTSANSAIAETQKRIAALREQPAEPDSPSSAPLASSIRAAPEGPKGPKKLSEVRVDPSIAAQFGRLPLPKPAPPAAPAAQARPPQSQQGASPDLGGHLLAPRPAAGNTAAPAAAASSAQPDLWGLDAPDSLTSDSRGFSTSDPFGGAFDSLAAPAAAPAATAQAQPQPVSSQDPFAALSAPAPHAPSDPFAGMAQPASSPAAFSKPADPPNRDPFASISSEVPGPAPNTAMARSPHARTDSFGSMVGGSKPVSPSMRGASGSPLKQGSGASAGPTGPFSTGQALPEDLFGPGPTQASASPHAAQYGAQQSRLGLPGQQPAGPGLHQQQQYSHLQPQHQQHQPYQQQQQFSQGGSPTAFGSFAGSQGPGTGMQGLPGGMQSQQGSQRPGQQHGNGNSSGSWQGSGGSDPYMGLGGLSTPPAQHFAAPPPPAKKDPFAGLTGF